MKIMKMKLSQTFSKGDNREWKGVEGGADEARLLGEPCFKRCLMLMHDQTIKTIKTIKRLNNQDIKWAKHKSCMIKIKLIKMINS